MNADKIACGFGLIVSVLKLIVMTIMKHMLGLLVCLVCVGVAESWLMHDDPCYLTPRYESG